MRSRLSLLVSAVLLGAAVAFPLGVLASHQFSDVPDSNQYHADIDALADSGVTTGCGGGKYCPDDFVTREQMAAFMNRLGALQAGKTPVVDATRLDGLDSSQFARTDVAVTGHYNCQGGMMVAAPNTLPYAGGPGGMYFISDPGYAFCPVELPDGATIKALRMIVIDESATGGAQCRLYLLSLTSAAGQIEVAATPATGDAEEPGLAILEDDTIDLVVDNSEYVFGVECSLGAPLDIRLKAVQIEYTLTGPAIP
jgi:hypothetical protein